MRPVASPPRRRRARGFTAAGALVVAGTATALAVAGTSSNAANAATAPLTATRPSTTTATTTTGPAAPPATTTNSNRALITSPSPPITPTANPRLAIPTDDQEWRTRRPGPKHPVELAADQMPGATSEGWKPDGSVMVQATTGHDIGFSECAAAAGSTSWIQNSYTAADGQDTADQNTFTYTNIAEAQAAFTAAADQMQACQPISRALQPANQTIPGTLTAQTAAGSGAYAWTRTWDGVDGLSAAAGKTHRYYVIVHADTLVIVTVTEYAGSPSAPIDAGANPRILTGLVIALDGRRSDTTPGV